MKNRTKIIVAILAVTGIAAIIISLTQKNEEVTTVTTGGATTKSTQGLGGLLSSIIPLFGNKKKSVEDEAPITTPDDNKSENDNIA